MEFFSHPWHRDSMANVPQAAWKCVALHSLHFKACCKMHLYATRMSAIAIGIHRMQTDVCENPFLLVLSESENGIEALSAGRGVDTFLRWWRERKIIAEVFLGFLRTFKAKDDPQIIFISVNLIGILIAVAGYETLRFKMGTAAWNHPSILSRFNSCLLSIPGLITFTFKALITAQCAPLSSSC